MKATPIIAGIILGIALATFGSGAELGGSCYATATQCAISVNSLSLCNTDTQAKTFSIGASAEQGSSFSTVPEKATLGGGECAEVRVFSAAECYSAPGRYAGEISVDTEGERIRKSCLLDVSQGHIVEARIYPAGQTASQCGEKIYDVAVYNSSIIEAQESENVTLTVQGIPWGWASLEKEQVRVYRGSPQTTRLTIKAPCDTPLGNYGFSVRASLANPDFYSDAKAAFTLSQGQSVDMNPQQTEAPGIFRACQEEKSAWNVSITNTGKQQDTFRLSLEGPEFAGLGTKSISLPPGRKAEVAVNFSPTGQKAGDYKLFLRVDGTAFGYSATKELTTRLEDCYGVQVTKLEGEENLCAEDEPAYRFSLKNDRARQIDLKATLAGISGKVDQGRIALKPGEEKTLGVLLDVNGIAKEGAAKGTQTAAELLVDTSGSMSEKNGQGTKMSAAKAQIIRLANSISGAQVGLREFGQGELCEDSVLTVPVGPLDVALIAQKVSAMEPGGKTPLSQALRSSVKDFPAGMKKALILISDGKETCAGNVDEAAMELAANNTVVYAAGFAIDEEGRRQLEGVASATKGRYFDVQDENGLADVLRLVSEELEIIPQKPGAAAFTLRLESANFSVEKDFAIKVSDCAGASLTAPDFYLCEGVAKEGIVTIANAGTEEQGFALSYTPGFVIGPQKATVGPGSVRQLKIVATAPAGPKGASKMTVEAVSQKAGTKTEAPINYLSKDTCFGIDLIVPVSEFDARAPAGEKHSLFIENRGAVGQTVGLETNSPYIGLADSEVDVGAGAGAEVNFFVIAPYDLNEPKTVTVLAATDRGFNTSAKLKINPGNASAPQAGKPEQAVQEPITVRDVGVPKAGGQAPAKDQNAQARATPEQGLTAPEKADEPAKTGTGLFSLANISTGVLAGLVVIVILLIAYSAYRTVQNEIKSEGGIGQPATRAQEPGAPMPAAGEKPAGQSAPAGRKRRPRPGKGAKKKK